jgi:hypothetical protein
MILTDLSYLQMLESHTFSAGENNEYFPPNESLNVTFGKINGHGFLLNLG